MRSINKNLQKKEQNTIVLLFRFNGDDGGDAQKKLRLIPHGNSPRGNVHFLLQVQVLHDLCRVPAIPHGLFL